MKVSLVIPDSISTYSMFCNPMVIGVKPSSVFTLLSFVKYAFGMVNTLSFFATIILASPESPGYNISGVFSKTASTLNVWLRSSFCGYIFWHVCLVLHTLFLKKLLQSI